MSQTRLGIDDASLPRKRKMPKRIDDHFKSKGDTDTTHHPETPEDMYRQIYRDAVDFATETIKSRFDQPDFEVYKNIQEVFFKALKGEQFSTELNAVHEVFGDDFKKDDLASQLINLQCYAKEPVVNARELVSFLQNLSLAQKRHLPQVVILAKLLLVMPATNAVSERSFSALRRVKTYLRATTTNKRLNHIMLMHIHKERTDKIDLIKVANEFVEWKDNRRQIFGTFSPSDISRRVACQSKSTQT